jgi:hypothetical protein
MAHKARCAFANLSLPQIEADFAAGKITGMGYHFLKDHVDGCPRGCRPLKGGELPPMQRYRPPSKTDNDGV